VQPIGGMGKIQLLSGSDKTFQVAKFHYRLRSVRPGWAIDSSGFVESIGAQKGVELLRLGRRIQAERKALGLSQNGFAQDCGLNRSFFGGIERGERNLTFAVLCKICNGLHCDIGNVTMGIPRASLRLRP
jgi:DNA-binding XRE family transcriptional regulator